MFGKIPQIRLVLNFVLISSVTIISNAQAPCYLCPPSKYVPNWFSLNVNQLPGDFLDGTSDNAQSPLQNPLLSIQPSLDKTKFYMNFAGSAYCPTQIANWSCPWCQAGYIYVASVLTSSNNFAYIVRSDSAGEIIIAIRGTTNAANVIQDSTFIQTPTAIPNVNVHSGYKQAADSVFPFVNSNLVTLTTNFPTYKVIITGHSLGAAEAALTLFTIRSNGYFPTSNFELYVYGMPRVGNQAYADYMNSQTIPMARVVNKADIVPHTYPAGVSYPIAGSLQMDRYYHHGQEIWIQTGANVGVAKYCSVATYEDPLCSDSLAPNYTISDHLTYYDVNIVQCLTEDAGYYVLQFIIPLNFSPSQWATLIIYNPLNTMIQAFIQLLFP